MNRQSEDNFRTKLWLRGEKAFGLEAVRRPVAPARQEQVAEAPRVTERAAPQVALFALDGHEVTAPTSVAPVTSDQPFESAVLDREEKVARLSALNENEVRGCTRCRLCETRTHTVFGEGDAEAKIFFLGEGPGENEDLSGRPFVGRAGQLLDKMIAGMGLQREQVYIANIVKCRPPGNRVPAPDEVATCTPYLVRQLEIIRPAVIVTLGLPSLKYMMNDPRLTMGRSRGQWKTWRGIKLMPTFHPAYVLRNPSVETRAAVWSDLKMVLTELGMKIPSR